MFICLSLSKRVPVLRDPRSGGNFRSTELDYRTNKENDYAMGMMLVGVNAKLDTGSSGDKIHLNLGHFRVLWHQEDLFNAIFVHADCKACHLAVHRGVHALAAIGKHVACFKGKSFMGVLFKVGRKFRRMRRGTDCRECRDIRCLAAL